MAYYRVLRVLLLLHFSSYCCLSQNPEQLLFASVREAVGEIKALSERVTDMDTRFTTKLAELETHIKASTLELETHIKANTLELQGGLELLQGQLVELQESSKLDNQQIIFMEILKEERNLQRDFSDHITELQANFSTELRQMECSSVEQISNLTVLFGKDECSERSHGCSPFAICEDAIVSYRCNCFPGYFGDGFTCEEIDECITGDARCHDDAQCINLPGNYTCDCSLGFSGDGFHCEDINECTGENRCHDDARCTNIKGNYTCACSPGLSGDGFHCEDIDECSTGENRCHGDAQCKNIKGYYTCACNSGFSGDGFHCEEALPCVSPSKIVPPFGCLIPLNEKKTWMEAKANCEDQGLILLEGISSRNELDELNTHFHGYFGSGGVWVGMYQWKWSESGDPTPSDSLLWSGDDPDLGTNDECGAVWFTRSTPVLFDSTCVTNYYSICQRKTKK